MKLLFWLIHHLYMVFLLTLSQTLSFHHLVCLELTRSSIHTGQIGDLCPQKPLATARKKRKTRDIFVIKLFKSSLKIGSMS